ncbi:hypothetical protein [Enterobacter kobei]|uniref:hypothetical protein n=1 Tax=Enterobacter kobei TaxID=208224 RepID=UPI00300C4146
MSFKAGFIAPPLPHTRGDSVSALSLIDRISKEAHRGCGLYYEIYHYRVVEALLALLPLLSAGDADTLRQCAAGQGFHLDDEAREASELAYRNVLNNIRREQE